MPFEEQPSCKFLIVLTLGLNANFCVRFFFVVTIGGSSVLFTPSKAAEKPAQKIPVQRKRKLVIDETLELSNAAVRDQMTDYADLVREQPFLPANKRKAVEHQLDADAAATIFFLPPLPDLADDLQDLVRANLEPAAAEPEEVEEPEEPRRGAEEPTFDHGDDVSRISEYPVDYMDEPPRAPSVTREEPPVNFGDEPVETAEPEEPEEMAPTAVTGGLSKQTLKVIDLLRDKFEEGGRDQPLTTDEIFEAGTKRKAAASTFFEILVLTTRGYLDVKQEKPYGSIELTAMESLFS